MSFQHQQQARPSSLANEAIANALKGLKAKVDRLEREKQDALDELHQLHNAEEQGSLERQQAHLVRVINKRVLLYPLMMSGAHSARPWRGNSSNFFPVYAL